MREILFRGKRKDNGEWVYGDFDQYNDTLTYIRSWVKIVPYLEAVERNVFPVKKETIGQYTGFSDMKGAKVYEGDFCIVKKTGMLACGFISFNQGCFLFEEKNTGNLLRLCDMEINGYQIEVRGNIHDNPELLEVQG